MSDDLDSQPDPTPKPRPPVPFSDEIARALCARVAAGESQLSICADPAMPSRATLWRWVQTRPAFAAAFLKARVRGGVQQANGRPSTLCEQTAQEVFFRLCEGEGITSICADPAMPSQSTIYYWRRAHPGFAETMRVAREIQAERFCDISWDIAQGVTPETARADRVKLAHLRWLAAIHSPKRFGRLKPLELDSHWQGGGMTIYLKQWGDSVHPKIGRPLEKDEVVFLRHDPPPSAYDEDEELEE